jgi:hypothetical protein
VAAAIAAVAAAIAFALAGGGDSPTRTTGRPHGHGRVTIAWVGDMSLSRDRGLPANGGRSLLDHVRPMLRKPGLTVGNLEGTLGHGGLRKCPAGTPNCFAFQAPARYARHYRAAGFDLMNLANNHAYDYGARGQKRTIEALARARLRYTGLPNQITVVPYRHLTVAFVGFAPYPWSARINDLVGARAIVSSAAQRADIVVVIMHAGGEGVAQSHTPIGHEFAYGEDRGDTRGFAHTAVDAGADLVLGSGPHVIRGMEHYRGRLIAYSVGDFLGYHTFGLGGTLAESAILKVRLDQDGRFHGGRWISLELAPPGIPKPDPHRRSARHMTALSAEDFGRNGVRVKRSGRLRLPKVPSP